MARKHEAERLLKHGACPSEIASTMGISVKSVIQYLCTRVGEGALRLSDVYFSWPSEKREVLQRARRGNYVDNGLLAENGLSGEELDLFESLRASRVFSGDMYEHISQAETEIHALVREILELEFGSNENGWWREGVPASIRTKCASRREEDDEPCDVAYAYTTLIDLSTIISKNWPRFQGVVPNYYAANRKQLDRDLNRLNRIRNAVMHPVKERKWTEDDFEFVRRIAGEFKDIRARAANTRGCT